MVEGYANPTVLNGTAGNSAPVGGRRHRKSVRKVSAKTIRKTLRHLGLKPKGRVVLKGGADMGAPAAAAPAAEAPKGGRRRKSARKSGLRKLFGL
jgi:signal recognition particle subunit SEC65